MLNLLIVLSLLLPLTIDTVQDPHTPTGDHAAMVMGFDQDKTAHHFHLYDDGGAIGVTVKDSGDVKNRDAIRSHLLHIASMFSAGNFNAPMLVHDFQNVPGTAALATLKDHITYRYTETPTGGRVDIVTHDPAALAALHQFLGYQIREHRTGDPLSVSRRK
jgi:hypothetical protein